MQSNITVVESQCDWLTVTCTKAENEANFRWWAQRLLSAEERRGNKVADYALRGYNGLRCGRCRWGLRVDGEMLQLSGDLAKDSAVKAATIADNASRIDLAVTVRQEPFDPALEFGHYHEIRGWEGPEGRKPTSTYIESSDGGSTFYLGKRTSDVMLRVYDKAAESGDDHYQNCHRYELEIKGDRAHRTLLALVQADASPSWIMSAVRCWASLHGVQPAFDVTSTVKLVSGFRRRSDADTKLDWLATAVKPTIDWLREFGRGSDASRVLGMDVDGAALGHALAANMGIADDGDEADL